MTVWHLIRKEIIHRKLSFALGILSVLTAAGVLVAELTLLDVHDLQTQNILAKKEAEIQVEMNRMENDYRVIMKEMGFNLLVLPKGQTLGDYYADGYASRDMPEEYVKRLADSKIMTIRHLLPSLEQKIQWPERENRTIILIGTRGEVPLAHRNPKEPILNAVPTGKIVLGYGLWSDLGLQPGSSVMMLGKEFEISDCHSERGTKDDITAWIDLAQAQQLLGKQGRINGILALKCLCEGNDIASIRRAVAGTLPETQVIEFESKSLARARARERAGAIADSTLAAERNYRATLRRERENLASWLIPLVIIGCTIWIGFLAFNNVRERRNEIGILRAIGLRSGQILTIFLAKSLAFGLIGALAGYAMGYGTVFAMWGSDTEILTFTRFFRPYLLLIVLISAPLLAVGASWVPALLAARQDPAVTLREE